MENLEEKSNNELMLDIKQMQLDYDAVKLKIEEYYTVLDLIEKKFNTAHDLLNKRLNGGI